MTKSELLQNAKPVLYNTEMVRAILDGRKTVTRRIAHVPSFCEYVRVKKDTNDNDMFIFPVQCVDKIVNGQKIPQHKVGDILYVRETFCKWINDRYYFRADPIPVDKGIREDVKWRPSIHMPKSAARIFLRVTGVRVERLRDITLKDMKAEGLKAKSGGEMCKSCLISEKEKCKESFCEITFTNKYSNDFACLWDSTIKEQDLEQYGWNANPWVWVYKFERVNVDG